MTFTRKEFLRTATLATAGLLAVPSSFAFRSIGKQALALSHFPDRMHAFLWRNWGLVTVDRLAAVTGAKPADIYTLAAVMGLPAVKEVSPDQKQRSYLTVIRRNWHLLPREQMLELLGWTDEQLTFTLQEDDFFYIKLGSMKPECEPVRFGASSEEVRKREKWLSGVVREEFATGFPQHKEPLFQFVKELSRAQEKKAERQGSSGFSPRFGYAYFALFGDPLLQQDIDPYPDGYLAQMSASGMDGTWLHIVLSKLTPFPWDPSVSEHWEQRLENLGKLVERAGKHGIGIYLYLNEPRFMPLAFFEKHPELKGVQIGEQAALCTSHPDVQKYLVDSMAMITSRVPGLAGFFSITASENHTHCWSHGKGAECPRCSKRGPSAVIAELNQLYLKGISQGLVVAKVERGPGLICWDWGWQDGWAEEIIPALPKSAALMSVSEWDLEITRGGVQNKVGEYSISSVGPGPRATKHWDIARKNGLKTIAKIQAGCTWEIAAVPYIPALENVAQHAENLRNARVDGLMLGWTLGGYPSPNLEVVAEMGNSKTITGKEAMLKVARRRYGAAGDAVTKAWQQYSEGFSEFPYHIGVVYSAPLQAGPSNLLWSKPTGYKASMVGLPYDDVNSWRANYPVEIFISQMQKVARRFEHAQAELRRETAGLKLPAELRKALTDECGVAETIAIHYGSVANQASFVVARDKLAIEKDQRKAMELIAAIEGVLRNEITLAKRMAQLQGGDSRLGFEASNHYFYVCNDLAEKVINCRDLLDHWLPELRSMW
ncbi:hypothetical protein [Dyadobacter jiangsuensis]|uniref:Uncharacterized protein n=1 Tax=Dyadobacter jiangsuensis TaxID=1591085 RepID=A0A2P8GIB6_9BACT|nr:hypothetical protein [Dyadobacter jiangsuensis]PSL33705.1 hypothetical protein CLV60_10174 [Dyadobacter jiangsuensis]